jgi:hypothetical protein
LKKPTKREIGSKSKKKDIYLYKQDLHNYFTQHNIYDMVDRLSIESLYNKKPEDYITCMNKTDKLITKLMIKAEKSRASLQHDSEWSIALHQQSLLCRYWLTPSKGMINGIDIKQQVNHIYDKLTEANKNAVSAMIKDKNVIELNKTATRELKKNKDIKKEYIKHHIGLRSKGMKYLAEIRLQEGKNEIAKTIN